MAVTLNPQFNIPTHQTHVAVGLSGGGDSMALAYMMCQWAVQNDRQIHLLTVNHNLREDALTEAEQVGAWVANFQNATHTILGWNDHEKPDTAVMEKARKARYELMADYCHAHAVQTLVIAHHGDDQLETFFFRLAKGSGLGGLTGMSEWTDYNETLKIYRPLLSYSHEELIQYCRTNNLRWVEDPSNENEKYARPRLRKALQNEGFDLNRFSNTLIRLSRAQEALDHVVEQFIKDNWNGSVLAYAKLKTHPLDIQIRVLQKCIAVIGTVTHSYPPKLERVEDIVATLKPNHSATLHGCVLSLSKDGNSLEIKAS